MVNFAVLLIALGAVVGLYMAIQHFKGRTPPKAGVAALGGLYLVSHHMRQRPLPNGVIVIHGLIAVIAFLILLTAVFLVP